MMRIVAVAVLGLVGCGGGSEVVTDGDPAGEPADVVGAAKPAGPPAADRPHATEAAVRLAIRELGARKKRVRDRAQEKLIMYGPLAIEKLHEAREASSDPETVVRIETVLRVLGEEGPYAEAIDLLLQQRYDDAVPRLERYLQFAQGRYKAQAEYLVREAHGLADWQGMNRPTTGVSARGKLNGAELWRFGQHHHNAYLFFQQRDIDAPVFYNEARDLYELALAKTPEHRRAWTNQAALLAAGGESEAAEASFEKALTIPQSSGWDLMDLALYYLAAGREDRAIDCIEQALPACKAERDKQIAQGTPESEVFPDARWWARESNDFDAIRENPRFIAAVRDR